MISAEPGLGLDVRPYEAADEAFVFATALNHLKSASAFGRALEREVFFPAMHRVLEGLLSHPGCRTYVATPRGDNTILGYLITEHNVNVGGENVNVIHFAFVKQFARRHGVLRRLLDAAEFGCPGFTLWTLPTDAEPWVRAKWPDIGVCGLFR